MRASSAGFGGRPIPQQVFDPDIILVQNNSGSDQDQFAVLGIDEPVSDISDADTANQFIENPVVKGVSPTLANHLGKFVVLIEAVASGKTGRGVISGIVPCKVKVESTASNPLTGQSWYQYADIEPSTMSRLILRPYGAAQVLWKANTTGDQWALVRLGLPGGITTLHGTLSASLSQGSYADASLSFNGSSYTQRVYDLLMKSGAKDIASGKKITATYFPDEQKFYVTEAECP